MRIQAINLSKYTNFVRGESVKRCDKIREDAVKSEKPLIKLLSEKLELEEIQELVSRFKLLHHKKLNSYLQKL